MREIRIKEKTPEGQTAEAFKSLRTNILFCGADKKVLMLTSCTPGEGKSSTSLQLAMSLAELGKRTLLMDTDLRRSVLLGKLAGSKEKLQGLAHFLSGQTELEKIIYATDVPQLHLICSGPFPPNPAELLGSELFRDTVRKLREEYDYVIIDTPPVGLVTDAAIIAQACDGIIMVIGAGDVNYRFAQEEKKLLADSGVPVLGVILNKVDARGTGYGRYGKYGRYGRHSGYYSGYYGNGEAGGKQKRKKKKETQQKDKISELDS